MSSEEEPLRGQRNRELHVGWVGLEQATEKCHDFQKLRIKDI
jgi:hypothetical protein